MTVQTFKEMLTRKPFMPVRLVTSSGKTYDIKHPKMAALTRTDILVGTEMAPEGVPNEFKYVSLLHITAIEPLLAVKSKRR